jgi:hypothetical protein
VAQDVIHKLTGHAAVRCQCVYCIGSREDLAEYAAELELQLAAAKVAVDPAGTDAMRLLEAIATIIDGPIADTRLHDWSGLPEQVRLIVRQTRAAALKDALQVFHQWRVGVPDPGFNHPTGLQFERMLIAAFEWRELPAPPDAKETP